jgi:hypothetical protein
LSDAVETWKNLYFKDRKGWVHGTSGAYTGNYAPVRARE